MEEIKLFSLIVPAFKQERTIDKDLENILKILSTFSFNYELIVVVDGNLDKTEKKALEIAKRSNGRGKMLVYSYAKNQGKGYAVKYGVLKAKGDVIGFIDAGMDIEPSSIPLLIDYMLLNNADIVVGSKLHPDSKVTYPLVRKLFSWGYRNVTHLMFNFDIKDTQVGLKIFKRKVARDIFQRILVKKFAFDIEMLAVAYSRGYEKIVEGPVKLNFSKASSITSTSFWRIVLRMLWDTSAVFYRLKILRYYDRIHR